MNFKPVFTPADRRVVWEITDIPIPTEVENVLNSEDWETFNKTGGNPLTKYHPEGRSIFTGDSGYIQHLFDDIKRKIVLHVKNQTDYDLNPFWPSLAGELTGNESHVVPFKDSAGMDMGRHLDNMMVFFTYIINLTDNPDSHTRYFNSDDSVNDTVPLYTGPTAKGTGILHVNSQYLHHDGVNFSKSSTRNILIGNLINYKLHCS